MSEIISNLPDWISASAAAIGAIPIVCDIFKSRANKAVQNNDDKKETVEIKSCDGEEERIAEKAAVIRSFYFETLTNKLVMDSVVQKVKQANSFDAIRTVAPLLKNDMGKLILYGMGNSSVEGLQNIIGIDNIVNIGTPEDTAVSDNAEDKNACGIEFDKPTNFLQAVKSCTERIELLRQFAQIPEGKEEYFKQIRFRARLNTVYKYTCIIEKTLRQWLDDFITK